MMRLVAAALLAFTALAPAVSQPPPPHHGPGADHRRGPGHGLRHHPRCRTVWRHHHRVRRCD